MKYVTDQPIDKMSKRFYAACAAMQGQIANKGLSLELNRLKRDIEYSFMYADELIKQEHEQKG